MISEKRVPWNKGLTASMDSRIATKTVKKNPFLYTKNDDYFSIINEGTAHWAGFIASDGCIRVNNKKTNSIPNVIEFTQKRSDREYLVQFAKDMEYTGPIHDKLMKWKYKKWSGVSETSTLCISGASKLCKDLGDIYNIHERKSCSLQPPNITNLCDKLAYVIGLIDGDGCIHRRNNSKYICIILVGSDGILNWVKNIFDELVPPRKLTTCAEVHKSNDGNYFRYSVNGYRSNNIYNILKDVNCYHMDRKWCF